MEVGPERCFSDAFRLLNEQELINSGAFLCNDEKLLAVLGPVTKLGEKI